MSELNSIRADADVYIKPEHRIDAKDQLEFADRVRRQFGQFGMQTALSDYNRDEIKERLQENKNFRINPAVRAAVWLRKANAKRLEGSELASLTNPAIRADLLKTSEDTASAEAKKWARLWTPEGGPVRDDITLSETERQLNPGLPPHDLRFFTYRGRPLKYESHIKDLLLGGWAKMDADGSVWTFPIMDMSRRPATRGQTGKVSDLHEKTDRIISPEALINLQIIHVIAGHALSQDIVDIANETVCKLHKNGSVAEVIGVVGVTNAQDAEGHFKYVRQVWWNANDYAGDFQRVEGFTGIGPLKAA